MDANKLDEELTVILVGIGLLSLIPGTHLGAMLFGWGVGRMIGQLIDKHYNKSKKN